MYVACISLYIVHIGSSTHTSSTHTHTHKHTRYATHADVLILFLAPPARRGSCCCGRRLNRRGGREASGNYEKSLTWNWLKWYCKGVRWQWAARAWAASLQFTRASASCHAPSGFAPYIWCWCSSRLVKTQEIISSFHKLLCRKSLQSNGRTHTPTHRDTHT